MKFPPHKCGLYLEHNKHKDYYQTAAEAIAEEKLSNSELEFESPDHERRAIETNEIWTLRWYPKTPVDFYSVAAPTLGELLEFANKVAEEDS